MKKVVYSFFIFILVLSACEESVNSTNSVSNTTESMIVDNLIEIEANIRNDGNLIIESKDPIFLGDKKSIEKAKMIPLNNWQGPFTATASRTVRFGDDQHFVGYVPGLASGLYIVDFLSYEAIATLPANTVAYVEDPIPVGWRDLHNRISGVKTFHFTGNSSTSVRIETYSVYVKYNLRGQLVDIEYPFGLIDGFEYTYYYIEEP